MPTEIKPCPFCGKPAKVFENRAGDRYRQEFEWAVEAILAKIEPLRKIVADLKNCPTTQAEVDAARSSGAAL